MACRFKNIWLKADGFKDLIRVRWNRTKVFGLGSYILMEKIKALKIRLKS